MSTLLVIGGTGFFGKTILDCFQRGRLEQWGVERVIAMARNAESLRSEAPQLISSQVELYSADISTTTTLPVADIVIHAAASTDAVRYFSPHCDELANIQVGTYNYCKLSRVFHAESKILYVSSGAVYGKQPADMTHLSENYVGSDLSGLADSKRDYAVAKLDAEDTVKSLGFQGLSVSIARCFAFVGTWLPRNQHFAIGNFIEDGLQGRAITVKARNAVYRSYMHTDDLVSWLMTIAAHANPDCPVYNVGSDYSLMMGELANFVAHEFGVNAKVPEITDPTIDRYIPSIEKARKELGLTLHNDFISAIRDTVRSIRRVSSLGSTILGDVTAKSNE
jgi:nucleoside-diphosphate-sugar epimerase